MPAIKYRVTLTDAEVELTGHSRFSTGGVSVQKRLANITPEIEKFRKMEILKLPADFDIASVTGLSAEGRQKLIKSAPRTLGQASRISGVPPSDIQLLWVAIESRRRDKS